MQRYRLVILSVMTFLIASCSSEPATQDESMDAGFADNLLVSDSLQALPDSSDNTDIPRNLTDLIPDSSHEMDAKEPSFSALLCELPDTQCTSIETLELGAIAPGTSVSTTLQLLNDGEQAWKIDKLESLGEFIEAVWNDETIVGDTVQPASTVTLTLTVTAAQEPQTSLSGTLVLGLSGEEVSWSLELEKSQRSLNAPRVSVPAMMTSKTVVRPI